MQKSTLDDTQQEVSVVFGCCPQAISKAYKRLGITRKKKTLSYKEQNPEKVKEYNEKIKDIPEEKIAYVDETGIDSYLYREYGYAPVVRKYMIKYQGKSFREQILLLPNSIKK